MRCSGKAISKSKQQHKQSQYHSIVHPISNQKKVGMNMFCPTTKVALHHDLLYLIICPTIFALFHGFPTCSVGQLKNRAKCEIGQNMWQSKGMPYFHFLVENVCFRKLVAVTFTAQLNRTYCNEAWEENFGWKHYYFYIVQLLLLLRYFLGSRSTPIWGTPTFEDDAI